MKEERDKIYSDFMMPIFCELIDLYEKHINNSSRLVIKLEEYNPYRNGYSIENNYNKTQLVRFEKYGSSMILISPRGSGLTFNVAEFNGDWLLHNCCYNKTLSDFCKDKNLVLTNDPHYIILHTTEEIVREQRLNKILE